MNKLKTKTLTRDGVLNLCDVGKVSGVGDSKAAHTVSMPPFLERQRKKEKKSKNKIYFSSRHTL